MEDTNYRNNFENFLRESIDDFKMIPSRKIWHSIYNNMHPDRKWPSITVCLLILVSILYLGVSNNNSLSKAARIANEQNASLLSNNNSNISTIRELPNNIKKEGGVQQLTANNNPTTNPTNTGSTITNALINTPAVETYTASLPITNLEKTKEEFIFEVAQKNKLTRINPSFTDGNIASSTATISSEENSKVIPTTNSISITTNTSVIYETDVNQLSKANTAVTNEPTRTIVQSNEDQKSIEPINTIVAVNESTNKDANKPTENNTSKELKKENKTLSAVSNVENKVSSKQAFISKFKENASISYYITPSIGYRNVHTIRDIKNNNIAYSSFAANNTLVSNSVVTPRDEKALNLEVGASMNYKITKAVRLKTGLQVNYTNYVSKVNDLGHPIQASLAVNNQQDVNRSSQYTTSVGSTNLNRSTLQIAVPIGADFKIIGNDKLKWYIGAGFQPTYVISGSAYVMSIDGKNYISEKPLLRKINFNTSLETYLSFKTSNGIIFNVGPQVRYQLLSTYKNNYNYSEKLYNVGVKIGVTTSF